MIDISSINPANDGFTEHYTSTTEEVRAQFDRWLERIKAEAWEEGMMSVKKHVSCWPKQDKLPVNPYRQKIE